ncbi:GntR family transcriptional regulator [Streptomyces sp. NPDC059785]|uniref:GntR family transcriptional regulator n=1 Tax=Streptomyces sp. NPDC059785 TaxID=3346945 RepID=UPI0036681C76
MQTPETPPFVSGRQVLADGVHEALLAMLVDGTLPPGSPMRTETLAKELQVSATPVREALARLESTGMVRRVARRGYRVAELPTREELAQLIELRLVLEPVNAERACAQNDPALIEALAGTVEAQQQAPTGPHYENFRDFLQADWAFHSLIAAHTGNPFLEQAFNSCNGYMQRYRMFNDHVISDAHESRAEHARILDAFRSSTPAAAATAMREHLEKLLARVRQQSA